MFDKLVESTTAKKKNRSGFFFATATVWMLALSTTIVAGIYAFDAKLSEPEELKTLICQIPPPPPIFRGSQGPVVDRAAPPNTFRAYEKAPEGISDPQPTRTSVPVHPNISIDGEGVGSAEGSPDGVIGGVKNGVPFGIPGSPAVDAPPPAPRQPDPPKEETEKPVQKRIPVRSVILQGAAIKRVEPSYPAIARNAGVHGAVIIEVTINEQGTVESARAMSGHPLLREPALNAARAWRWNPTFLNGMTVKVIGTITFNFRL